MARSGETLAEQNVRAAVYVGWLTNTRDIRVPDLGPSGAAGGGYGGGATDGAGPPGVA